MVHFDLVGRVAVITLDRPEARNAVNGETSAAIEEAIDRIESDDEIWVGIVTARGPVFCAGADLKEIAAGREMSLRTERGGFGGITRRVRTKPMIAAVDGLALAGGCEITLACDLIVASTAAGFGTPEVKRGLLAGAGGVFRLARVLPLPAAMELALTGDPLAAKRAYDLGMVNDLCEPGQVLERAMALADRICANGPVAVRTSRDLMLRTLHSDDAEAWKESNDAWQVILASEDYHEGPRAFVEKRPPVWTGR